MTITNEMVWVVLGCNAVIVVLWVGGMKMLVQVMREGMKELKEKFEQHENEERHDVGKLTSRVTAIETRCETTHRRGGSWAGNVAVERE